MFTINKSLVKISVVFPTVFLPSCNKKKHIGVITVCKVNDALVTQSVIHGPVIVASPGRVSSLFFEKGIFPGPSTG